MGDAGATCVEVATRYIDEAIARVRSMAWASPDSEALRGVVEALNTAKRRLSEHVVPDCHFEVLPTEPLIVCQPLPENMFETPPRRASSLSLLGFDPV